MSVYELIVSEKWDEAIERASIDYERSNSVFDLRNLIPALLVKKMYNNVLNTVEEIWKNRGRDNENEFIWASIANVGLGDVEMAVELLENSRKCKYSDPTGGIEVESMIYAISLINNLKDKQRNAFNNICKIIKKNENATMWPASVGLYMVDKISFESLLGSINIIESLYEKQSCQGYFYKGIKAYEKKEYDNFLINFSKCREFIPQSYFVYEFHLSIVLEELLDTNKIN